MSVTSNVDSRWCGIALPGLPAGPARFLSRGGGLKASVTLHTGRDRQYVVKDYSATPWYLRPLARYLARREVRILRALADSPHVPRHLGCIDAYRFAMEYIPGEHPSARTLAADDNTYGQAVRALQAIHALGFAHNDLRGRNMLVSPGRGVIFIDLAAALRFPAYCDAFALRPLGWLRRRLQEADFYHLLRQKRALSTQPYTAEERDLLAEDRPFAQITRFWKHWIYRRTQRRL
ncbi:MAG: phosphotransferase [Haliea sp.]|uniref:RIO1 family regulatory kinase/ATPase domain-containing protein n=1 Tax=Haliea sp. TaxID=1932666 RepID=UPI0032EB39BA